MVTMKVMIQIFRSLWNLTILCSTLHRTLVLQKVTIMLIGGVFRAQLVSVSLRQNAWLTALNLKISQLWLRKILLSFGDLMLSTIAPCKRLLHMLNSSTTVKLIQLKISSLCTIGIWWLTRFAWIQNLDNRTMKNRCLPLVSSRSPLSLSTKASLRDPRRPVL